MNFPIFLWVTRVSDGETFPVTDGTSQDWSPGWSRDGRRLFYVSNREGSTDLWQQRIDADGARSGEPQRITTGIGLRSAVFSPDGSELAYTRGRSTVSNVWRVPLLSEREATWSDAEQFTLDEAFIEFIDLSPDGQQLVLSSDRSGEPRIWRAPAQGGDAEQLTHGWSQGSAALVAGRERDLFCRWWRSGIEHLGPLARG